MNSLGFVQVALCFDPPMAYDLPWAYTTPLQKSKQNKYQMIIPNSRGAKNDKESVKLLFPNLSQYLTQPIQYSISIKSIQKQLIPFIVTVSITALIKVVRPLS